MNLPALALLIPSVRLDSFISRITKVKSPLKRLLNWKSDLSDEELLEKLLALNLERGKAQVTVTSDGE